MVEIWFSVLPRSGQDVVESKKTCLTRLAYCINLLANSRSEIDNLERSEEAYFKLMQELYARKDAGDASEEELELILKDAENPEGFLQHLREREIKVFGSGEQRAETSTVKRLADCAAALKHWIQKLLEG